MGVYKSKGEYFEGTAANTTSMRVMVAHNIIAIVFDIFGISNLVFVILRSSAILKQDKQCFYYRAPIISTKRFAQLAEAYFLDEGTVEFELPDGVDSLRELRKELKYHIKRISRLTDLISKKNEEWTQLIQRSVPARAKEEEELYEETTKGEENFLEIWLQG
ncbi:hypothetical protein Tcan_18735 [Toxocara canis]|uniref:Uncharacterized protein n=1 Tax=Toxocara canis TaxID=6265 RepID=A0A0B2W3A5_TOXCA|nr:hypothetical protein Tcan_18735 [Toxocara canis]